MNSQKNIIDVTVDANNEKLFAGFFGENSLANEANYARRSRWFMLVLGLTAVFMWAYSLIAYIYVGPLCALIGVMSSLLHASSALVLRRTKSVIIATYVLIGAGFIFQISFSYLTGGFYSATLMWLAFSPLLVSVLTTRKHGFCWMLISLSGILGLFALDRAGLTSSPILSGEGLMVTQLMVAIGMTVLVGTHSIFLLSMGELYHRELTSKNSQIRSLMRMLSHDLVNPLTIAQAKVSRIKMGRGDVAVEVEKIGAALETIKSILTRARDLDAIDSGKIGLEIRSSDLRYFKDQTNLIFSEALEAKNLRIDWSNFDERIAIATDPEIFSNQVFNNLISNAIKFSYQGSTIAISTRTKNSRVVIEVRDFGKGIARDDLPRIFEASKKTTTTGTNGERGTGFGLLLCKSFVEQMGGSIHLSSRSEDESPEEHGTSIELTMPKAS